MHTIALINQKGGVGKTTNTVNIAAQLVNTIKVQPRTPWNGSRLKAVPDIISTARRALVIDLDPQAQSTLHCGLSTDYGSDFSPAYKVLIRGQRIVDERQPTAFGFDLLAAGDDLVVARRQMGEDPNGVWALKEALEELAGAYDVVLLDCPPSLDHLSQAALIASTGFLVPMVMQEAPLKGFAKLLETIDKVRKRQNPNLMMVGVLGCNTPRDSGLAKEVRADIAAALGAEAMFEREIRYSEFIARGMKVGQPVIAFAPHTIGAEDYAATVEELERRGAA